MNLDAVMSMKRVSAMLMALCATTLIASCGGGDGGDGASTVEKSTIVVGKLAAPKKLSGVLLAAGDPITVSLVSDPAISTTVGTDGSFTLRGLPAGSFTLQFMQGATDLGKLTFTEVAANQQITITVEVATNEIVLVEEDRTGIGHAGVELEGPVQNVVILNAAADSKFVIENRTVIARPGVTAIREGNTRRTVNDVTVGKRVHVKATTLADSTDLLAFEIKIQNEATDGAAGGDAKMTICHIPGGDPAKAKTLSIGASAWPAHQAHGDTEGACKP